jgi:phosphate ABC transporter phosphate-binding protein
MKRASLVRILAVVVVGAGLAAAVYYSPSYFIKEEKSDPSGRLKTGGTSSAQVIIENRWKTAFRNDKNVQVEYDSAGSTAGATKMIDKELAVAFVHAPLSDEQRAKARAKGGEVVHVPVVICAVVPVYNVKELKDKLPLKFTGELLADIYLGKVTKWNDPAIKALNEGVALPETPIVAVHRSDSSGTTFLFTDYLAGASEAWQKQMGPARSEVKWPVGVGAARSQGVAAHVDHTEGAIGYIDLIHAYDVAVQPNPDGKLWGLVARYGSVQNKDKSAFILADPDNMTAAAKGVTADMADDLTFKLTNKPGKDSYPICGAIWAVCYQAQPAADKPTVVDFLNYVTHEGQHFAKKTSYAPLPDELIPRVEQKISSITAAP